MTVLMLGSTAGFTHAMSLAPAPLAVLVAEAEIVVHGLVLTAKVEPVPGHPRRLRTRHKLWVWEHLKAPEGKQTLEERELEFLQPGGRRGSLQTLVPGVTTLVPGDEVILLLTRTPWGLQPLGYPLGTFLVDGAGTVVPTWPGYQVPRGRAALESTLRGRTP
jgi:hypothetical protein